MNRNEKLSIATSLIVCAAYLWLVWRTDKRLRDKSDLHDNLIAGLVEDMAWVKHMQAPNFKDTAPPVVYAEPEDDTTPSGFTIPGLSSE